MDEAIRRKLALLACLFFLIILSLTTVTLLQTVIELLEKSGILLTANVPSDR